MASLSLETQADHISYEDGQQTAILALDTKVPLTHNHPQDPSLYILIQSWDPQRQHPELMKLFGQRLKVTVEVVE